MRPLPVLLALGAAMSACSDPELEMRVAQLETEVAQLKKNGAQPAPAPAQAAQKTAKPAGAAQGNADPARTEAAIALFREANQLVAARKYDEARAKLNQLKNEYGDTPAARSGDKVLREIEVIGKPTGPLQVEKWYQGQTEIGNEPTLLVFWEAWCPHCKREVPKLEELYQKHKGKMAVIGLTKQTRNITDDQVKSFIEEKGIHYPIAKEADGAMSRYYNVSGIPAAAVVKDGKVVWRGHPARITEEMIAEWTGS